MSVPKPFGERYRDFPTRMSLEFKPAESLKLGDSAGFFIFLKGGIYMYFKKVTGDKCYLSPIDTNDYEKYLEWLNDPEVATGLIIMAKILGVESEKEALEHLAKNTYSFAIVDLEKDELLGNCGFSSVDFRNRNAEVGIFIGNKSYWGKGYGVEALKLILDFGFNVLNLHNIHLTAYSFNKQAIKCYKKVGFKEAGRIRECKLIGGNKYDEVLMDILSSEFNHNHVKNL